MNCGSIFSADDDIAVRIVRNPYEALKYCQKDGEKNKSTIENRDRHVVYRV